MTDEEEKALTAKILSDFSALWKDIAFLKSWQNSAYLMSRVGGRNSRVSYLIGLISSVEPDAVVKIHD